MTNFLNLKLKKNISIVFLYIINVMLNRFIYRVLREGEAAAAGRILLSPYSRTKPLRTKQNKSNVI